MSENQNIEYKTSWRDEYLKWICGFANANGFVGHLHVHGVGVGFRIDRHRADIQFLAGADDADGDLTAVRDQNLLKHAWGGWSVKALARAQLP